ncbi:hypothetical protein DITRI_Ditri17bG0067500 [Diplodiscus trichospermus]
MASHHLLVTCLTLPLLATLLARMCAAYVVMYPFVCSQDIGKCDALLYHVNNGLEKEQIASYYSVDPSTFRPIFHGTTRITLYQSLVLEKISLTAPTDTSIMHPIRCNKTRSLMKSRLVFTVDKLLNLEGDALSDIASLLSANLNDIQSLNSNLTQNPDVIYPGRRVNWTTIIVILSAIALCSTIALLIILIWRKKAQQVSEEDQKPVSQSKSVGAFSLQKQFLCKENIGDVTAFESERPVIYSLQEIEEATSNFDESKKIGTGGYDCVYHGMLGQQEVAVKKMKSKKSKEFLAEINVLCKIHNINVVELLGFGSGDDHLYLVYEYVQNGSLSDHLHDPLLKCHRPLSWTARTQIALDAAKGIEYIHDHTKARYVHRDIKTSNILLDKGLRAKVADFGLAKLVERTNEEDLIATQLVGTPGYLPPESVMELQVTPKTDVFAFGVVLAELITGQRALVHDNREPNKVKSLITVVNKIFTEEDPESALEEVIDGNLRGCYPMEDVYKMAELAEWCLSDEAVNRPEIREIVLTLSQIVMSSVEWEASVGGSSQVFSRIFKGR